MNEEKSHIKYYSIKLGVYTVLAVLVFIFREPLVENLKYFIGGLMLLYGLEEILFEVLYSRHHILHQGKIYLSFIELLLGIVVLVVNMPDELEIMYVCIIWATWSILREAYEIKEIFSEIKCLVPKIISGTESLVIIVFSVLLIMEPGEHHAMIHLYLLLAELIISPLTPLLDETLAKKKEKKNKD